MPVASKQFDGELRDFSFGGARDRDCLAVVLGSGAVHVLRSAPHGLDTLASLPAETAATAGPSPFPPPPPVSASTSASLSACMRFFLQEMFLYAALPALRCVRCFRVRVCS